MSSSASSSSSSSTRKMLTLKSSGGEVFEVEVPAIVSQSDIIATMVGEGQVGSAIPLPDYVSSETLSKVVEYCNKHHASGLDESDIQEWDAKFVDMGSYDSLFDLVMVTYVSREF
ncbi:hypothetical protein CDL15_Pgr004394 [Punica granatum]|uniref:SKP1 component POZ domain-containing protein n=1 Tax=Punica granatum TaxID=22663 RepID=A0A218XGA8_PUNGR|nr:hypothetical protein CDL15_Pgr004394 [Punica granatum]